MKLVALSLVLAIALVGYPIDAADPPPSTNSTPPATGQPRLGTSLLGMLLVDPTQKEIEQHQMEYPLPLVVQLEDPAFFLNGMAPTQGCAFWIVEPPANGFLFNHLPTGLRYPKTVRELLQAIIACTASPQEYQKLCEQSSQFAREFAESLQAEPGRREYYLKIANSKISRDEAGKYICRVVYNYPDRHGTMTTHIHMTRQDLDGLRALLRK